MSRSRAGASIMEVLFAIAVLTIGLLGVAFILPVATNNAASSLRDDRTTEEISNRVASDLANIGLSVTNLVAAENSAFTPAFYNQNPRPSDLGFDVTRQRFFDVPLDQLPRAFVIDPWFLTSANNLRSNDNNGNLNGYDRTLFPCYDRNFVPTISPSAPIGDSLANTWNWGGVRDVQWNTPRFVRLSLPASFPNTVPGLAVSRASATSGDDLSLVVSEDATQGAGLFFRRSTNPMRSLSAETTTGRFSSIVMMSRSAAGSNLYDAAVVTMQDRQLVTVPGGEILGNGDDLKHQLRPYTAAGPNATLPRDEELTYPGEVIGYVTDASKPFVGGGGGEFIFRTSAATKPDVREGGWICLMRQEFAVDPLTTDPGFRRELLVPSGRQNCFDSNPEGPLRFAWYRITDVSVEPTLDPTETIYQTQLKVRGPDWVFHPSQIRAVSATTTLWAPPYGNGVVPNAAAPPVYSFDNTGHPDFGTIVVLMPDVVSVKQFPFRFE